MHFPFAFSILWALKYCGGLMFFMVIFTWFVWEIPNRLSPSAPCWLLLCSAVTPLTRADWAAEDSVALWFQPSPSLHTAAPLAELWWLVFHTLPRVSSAWWRHEKVRTAKERQNTTWCFKENTRWMSSASLVFTQLISVFNNDKSLWVPVKNRLTAQHLCVLQFSMPKRWNR